jgi:predicted RNase H-like HicB family nuclease
MTEVLDYEQVGYGHVWFRAVNTAPERQEEVSFTLTAPAGDAHDRVSGEWVEGLPLGLVRAYAERAVLHAHVREVDPAVWVATVAGLEGAYGNGGSSDEACDDLCQAVVGWVAVKRRLGLPIPVLEGLDLNVPVRPGHA